MEPLVVASVLSSLISIGLRTEKALGSDGFGEAEIEALKTFLDSGSSILSRFKGKKEPRAAALQLALTGQAFGQALARHWAGSTRMVPGSTILPKPVAALWDNDEHDRREEIEVRTKQAAVKLYELGNAEAGVGELELLGALTGQPENTPYYRALWSAFSNPNLSAHEDSPLLLQPGTALEFARHFRLAYAELTATPAGRRVQDWLRALIRETPELTREVLAQDLANWGERHVFGNVKEQSVDDPLPFMSLDAMYVEPKAKERGDRIPEPIQGLILGLLAEHTLVVVQADFGHGKSLTARWLTRALAKEYVNSASHRADLRYPIFIKCSRDISDSYAHERVVRTALWNTARESIGPIWSHEFAGFERPNSAQQTLYVLDGLDELAFGQGQIKTLFCRLEEVLDNRHRAVVFTRPGALSPECLPTGTPVVTIQPFEVKQIQCWFEAWCRLPNRTSIGYDQLPHSLRELATIPILLLMIATTWKPGEAAVLGRAALYEKFIRHIARGKHTSDPDPHTQIKNVSTTLLECLRRQGELASDEDEPLEAMLWMMSRIAWEGHVLTYGVPFKELRSHRIESLLDEEFGLPSDLAPRIMVGLLVALQHDPIGGSANLLFGHQSFREFLVARFWKTQLVRISQGRGRGIESRLMRGRLLHREDHAFEFLCEMLADLGESDRGLIRDWAEKEVNDDTLNAQTLRGDTRSRLRESALAIGSVLSPEGLRIVDVSTLRSLVAWFEVNVCHMICRAPYLQHRGAILSGAALVGADLFHANLADAHFIRSALCSANLDYANLAHARFYRADLEGASLHEADLRGAILAEACLAHADLRGANLRGADLSEADLSEADLSEADLSEADLRGVCFLSANLHGTKLVQADVGGTDLEVADGLTAAQLQQAKNFSSELLADLVDDSEVPF